jgi:beta-hydroxylase
MEWSMQTRHWIVLVFVASALFLHLRGRVRFGLLRALTDYVVLLAPVNALMVLFSRVKPNPYADPAQVYPELDVLQRQWQAIRAEAMALDEGGRIRAATGLNDLGFNSFFRTGWKRFYLKWYGEELASANASCPQTVALLNSIPGIKAAMFASLPPGARLVRHRDPYAGSLRYHLGLFTPNSPDCYIEVDGQHYHWKDGEAIVFDESFIHHAENKTEQPRVILFCDVERPVYGRLLTAFNRWFGNTVMRAAASQNEPGEKIGAINRAFDGIYRVRLRAKALKASHRRVYYAGKWLLIGALVFLLLR